MSITLKRVYDKPDPEDGERILVDALWPRGQKKKNLKIDFWMREIAPSPELRRWYSHDPEKWQDFRTNYRSELAQEPRRALVQDLRRRARSGRVTLVFGARDAERSNAAVLAEVVRPKLRKHQEPSALKESRRR
jgi:uncharacterized protein YeaO (DUF488 family)